MPATKKLVIGDIHASAAVFRSPFAANHFYICGRDGMDYLEFSKRYEVGNVQCARATGVNLEDGCSDHFYMVYCEDCFSPPIAIVRADTKQGAVEGAIEECAWMHMSAEMVEEREADGLEDTVGYGPSGQPYDNETLQCREVKIVRVEVD